MGLFSIFLREPRRPGMTGICRRALCRKRTGAPDTIRTCDLCLRRATLYPVARLRSLIGREKSTAWAVYGLLLSYATLCTNHQGCDQCVTGKRTQNGLTFRAF